MPLTVTVKEGEPLHIGDNIVVYFEPTSCKRQVRLTVDAPKGVKVLRDELKEEDRKQ